MARLPNRGRRHENHKDAARHHGRQAQRGGERKTCLQAELRGSAAARAQLRVEQAGRSAQINTFGGGVNEIQREIVAWMGLGMTRGAR